LITFIVTSICYCKDKKESSSNQQNTLDIDLEVGGNVEGNCTIEPEIEVEMVVDAFEVEVELEASEIVVEVEAPEVELEVEVEVPELEMEIEVDANVEVEVEVDANVEVEIEVEV